MWILRTLLAASAVWMLAGCTNGGGSATVLFIGTNGAGNCSETLVVVDLEAAGARVSRSRNEHPECRIDALLEASGCDARFLESNGRDELRIVVDGCRVPATAALASCAFLLGDEKDLTPFVTTSHCDCTTEQCFETLGTCIGESDDPGDCEHCTNQVDDDGNGQTDCADANCSGTAACAAVTTTTTTTSTSNSFVASTPTTDPTTTTEEVPFLMECRITFRLQDDVRIGALQWDTEVLDPNGQLVGTGDDVDCLDLTPASISSFNRTSGTTLRAGLISLEGVEGPADLAECWYRTVIPEPGSHPVAGDFEVFVRDASDTESNPVQPFPDVLVSIGECMDVGAD